MVRAPKIGFDGWTLEPDSGDLERAGTRIRLQEQALQVLLELVAAGGGLVTREQLMAKLWPRGVVDFDTGLNTVIRKLRVALGDTADTPRYIETLPRRGYRFIAALDVKPEVPAAAIPAAPVVSAPQSSPLSVPAAPVPDEIGPVVSAAATGETDRLSHGLRRRRLLWRTLLALGTVVGLLTLLAIWHRARGVDPVRPQESVVVTTPTRAPVDVTTVFAPPSHSIAVLPFVNLSSDKEQEYFADGLAEELLDLLAKTPGLHVIARTSSFSFKGKPDDIPTIAAKLKVAHILEGSVRKSGNRLRVSTQLVRAADGEHVWSETYDQEVKDVFKMQDEIAAAVVAALQLKLSPGQGSSPSRSTNVDAYFQYMLGQQYYSHFDNGGGPRSIAAYRQAIALDPQYAAAYAGLAIAEYEVARDVGDGAELQRASAAAEHAIELAPDQPLGYSARGYLRVRIAWDWTGAQADFAKALALDPSDPVVLRRYSLLLAFLGRLPESIAVARRATDLDPFSAQAWSRLCEALKWSGDLSAAREAIHRSLAIDPTNDFYLSELAETELRDQQYAEALAELQRISSDSLGQWQLTRIAMAEHSLGHAKESQQALDEAITRGAQTTAYWIAEAYAWRGEKEGALAWLERAYRQRDAVITSLKINPLLVSLRGDPRYKALLKKINLPE